MEQKYRLVHRVEHDKAVRTLGDKTYSVTEINDMIFIELPEYMSNAITVASALKQCNKMQQFTDKTFVVVAQGIKVYTVKVDE